MAISIRRADKCERFNQKMIIRLKSIFWDQRGTCFDVCCNTLTASLSQFPLNRLFLSSNSLSQFYGESSEENSCSHLNTFLRNSRRNLWASVEMSLRRKKNRKTENCFEQRNNSRKIRKHLKQVRKIIQPRATHFHKHIQTNPFQL